MKILVDNLVGILLAVSFVALVSWLVDRAEERREWNTPVEPEHPTFPWRTEPPHPEQRDAPSVETLERVRDGLRHTPPRSLYVGRHNRGTAPGTDTQRLAWEAEQFALMARAGWDTGEREVLRFPAGVSA